MRVGFFAFTIVVLVVLSCREDPQTAQEKYESQLRLDTLAIDAYLQEKGIVAVKSNSGLRYVIHEKSSSTVSPRYYANDTPPGDCFVTSYKGMVVGVDTIFDQNVNFKTSLAGSIINGWKLGFQFLDEGDSATLYIPSVLAYGSNGRGEAIPANANLFFHVRLKRVFKQEYNPATGLYSCFYDEL